MPDSPVYVTARDPKTGKSKSVTVYDATPEQVIDLLRAAAEDASDAPQDQPAEQPA